jgi:hypothetical protein
VGGLDWVEHGTSWAGRTIFVRIFVNIVSFLLMENKLESTPNCFVKKKKKL